MRHSITTARHVRCPEGEDRQVTGKPLLAVVTDQAYSIASAHTDRCKGSSKLQNLLIEFGIRDLGKTAGGCLRHLSSQRWVFFYDLFKDLRDSLVHITLLTI